MVILYSGQISNNMPLFEMRSAGVIGDVIREQGAGPEPPLTSAPPVAAQLAQTPLLAPAVPATGSETPLLSQLPAMQPQLQLK